MARIPNPYRDGEAGPAGPASRNPVLHDADPRDLEAAADELRDRTMTLEPDEMMPGTKLLFGLLAVAAVTAVGTIVFRGELRTLLGLS